MMGLVRTVQCMYCTICVTVLPGPMDVNQGSHAIGQKMDPRVTCCPLFQGLHNCPGGGGGGNGLKWSGVKVQKKFH